MCGVRGRVAVSVGRVFVFLGNPCDETQDKDKWMDADKTVEIKLNPLEMDKEALLFHHLKLVKR